MNMVIHYTRIARQRAPSSITLAVTKLPVYVRVMLLIMISVVAMAAGWTIRFRPNIPVSNPFADYAGVLPGQPRSALDALWFSCHVNNVSDQGEYCTRAPASGPFSLAAATISHGIVSRLDFAFREGALTAGDLGLLWGRPHVRLYRQSVTLEWPDLGVSANGWAESRRFSYFIPVQSISFGPQLVPKA